MHFSCAKTDSDKDEAEQHSLCRIINFIEVQRGEYAHINRGSR